MMHCPIIRSALIAFTIVTLFITKIKCCLNNAEKMFFCVKIV